MSKNTPGPWTVLLTGTRGMFHILEAADHEAQQAELDGVDGHTVSSANASMIAAAPELLEALKDVSEQARHRDYDWPLWLSQAVASAIAKATGEQA